METRICKHCNKELPITDFYLNKPGTNWRKHACKYCQSKSAAMWNKLHKEQKNSNNRKYYQSNPEARKVRADRAEKWRNDNYGRYRDNIDNWLKNNHAKISFYSRTRYERITSAPINDFTAAQWEEIKERYGYRCVYCGKRPDRLTRDHIIPISKGGSHTASNIVPACKLCNSKKHVKDAPVFQMTII